MIWKDVAKDWPAFTSSITARWPDVDAEIVADLAGDRAAFNVYLGQVYKLTPREAEEQIAEWLAGPLTLDAVTDQVRDMTSLSESAPHTPEEEDVFSHDAKFGDANAPVPPIGRRA